MNLEIKVLMLKKQITQTDIAKRLKIKPSTVSGVLNNGRSSRRVQQAIADAVGVPYEKLWGKAA